MPMRRETDTESYAERKRRYVSEIRKSFDEPAEEDAAEEMPQQLSLSRLQLAAAVALFACFLLLWSNGGTIFGYQAEEIMELISDNHYYEEFVEAGISDGADTAE